MGFCGKQKAASAQSQVLIIRVKDPSLDGIKTSLSRGFDAMDFHADYSGKRVLIKPNLCYYWDYTTGETTDPRLVSAIIDFLREKCSAEEIAIVESDASAMKASRVFEVLGYTDLAMEKGARLVNLSADETVFKEVEVSGRIYELQVPRILLNPDVKLINVPKLKVGPFSDGNSLHISCALKNIYGCIQWWRKSDYHASLNEYIVAINKLVKSDFVVADGLIALGKHPVRLGAIVTGSNPLAVDSVVSRIMGYNPKRVRHLRLAEKEGLGNVSVVVEKDEIDDLRRFFPRRNRFLFSLTWRFQLLAFKTYVKLVGDIIPPPLEGVIRP